MKSPPSLSLSDLTDLPPSPRRPSRGNTRDFTFSAKNFLRQRTGRLSDAYEVGELLGSGSYGEVYSCVHKDTEIERAVKILPKPSQHDEFVDDEVMTEANILKQLDHPNILRPIEILADKDHYYIVTEICRGGELLDEIQTWGNFIEEDAAELMRHLLAAVNYCHQANVVHRDLKPENILLEDDKDFDSIKIIDFGLARLMEREDTEMYDFAGTLYYCAPEVFHGAHTSKVDIWSCGVIAFVVLGGYAPFDGHTDEATVKSILKGEVSFEDEVWEDVSDEAKDFITSLLAKDPLERPTAEQALKHPWIQERHMATSERLRQRESANVRAMEALTNLGRFNAQSKLKQATCAFIASQLILKEEKKRIDELFHALDVNFSGRLTKDDVRIGYKNVFGKDLPEATVEEMFDRIDYDSTGFIEYSEFIIATMNEKDLLDNGKLRHAFNMFDADGSGLIAKDELREVLQFFQSVDNTLDSQTIDQIVSQVDADDDGLIDYDEFTTMMFKTAEDAVEEESMREEEDPIQVQSAATMPGTFIPHRNQSAINKTEKFTGQEHSTNFDSSPSVTTKATPACMMIPGAMGTKACLALFERNIQKNKELGYDSKPPTNAWKTRDTKKEDPIEKFSRRLSTSRHKRASLAGRNNHRSPPTPVNRSPKPKPTIEGWDFRASAHSPIPIRTRAASYEEIIEKNQARAASMSPKQPTAKVK